MSLVEAFSSRAERREVHGDFQALVSSARTHLSLCHATRRLVRIRREPNMNRFRLSRAYLKDIGQSITVAGSVRDRTRTRALSVVLLGAVPAREPPPPF